MLQSHQHPSSGWKQAKTSNPPAVVVSVVVSVVAEDEAAVEAVEAGAVAAVVL